MLPKKWCVKITLETASTLKKWAEPSPLPITDYKYVSHDKNRFHHQIFPLISWKDFQENVLGVAYYTLKDPNLFYQAVKAILPNTHSDVTTLYPHQQQDEIETLKEAQILSAWYDTHYKSV